MRESFPDPAEFDIEEKFNYAAKVASVFKKVIAELFVWLDTMEQQTAFLQKKEEGKVEKDKFAIGKGKSAVQK